MKCGYYEEHLPTSRIRSDRRSPGNAKAYVHEILATLAEDVSLEEIQHHIEIRQKIDQGWDHRDSDMEEIQRRVADWLTKWSSRAWPAAR